MESLFENIIHTSVSIRKVWGIHCLVDNEGKYRIAAMLLALKNNTVNIIESRLLSHLGGLDDILAGSVPISVSVDSNKILHCKVSSPSLNVIKDEVNISDWDSFYLQLVEREGNYYFAFVRKIHIDPLLTYLFSNKAPVVSILLGAYSVYSACVFFDSDVIGYNTLVFDQYCLSIGSGEVSKVDDLGHEFVEIGRERVPNGYVVSYCNALAVFLDSGSIPYVRMSEWKGALDNYLYKSFLKKTAPILLGFFFLILTINFIVLQYQNNKSHDLNLSYTVQLKNIEEMKSLVMEYDKKKNVCEQLGIEKFSFTSYYADRIALTITKGIRLTSLTINPLVSNTDTKHSTKYSFNNDRVLVEGLCSSAVDLNQWVLSLKKQNFVVMVSNQTYRFDEFDAMGHFSFEISVTHP